MTSRSLNRGRIPHEITRDVKEDVVEDERGIALESGELSTAKRLTPSIKLTYQQKEPRLPLSAGVGPFVSSGSFSKQSYCLKAHTAHSRRVRVRKQCTNAPGIRPGKITAYLREYNSIRARKHGDRKNHTIPYHDRRNNRIGVHRLTNFPNGPTNPAEHRSTLRITSNNRMKPFKRGTISGLAGKQERASSLHMLVQDSSKAHNPRTLYFVTFNQDKRIPDLVGIGAAISFASGLTERMEWTEKSSYRATSFEPDC
ncbi:hypothetical protein H5410_055778 [Solanum commersonii]|uniref:Uncharacterized protein n=1 Tax=Solanum commersonii TaxID=4109 RepID=A0A9J5WKC8_SOLCO|nr:hypothetical protein H5410_055778 [Solanum commersonii]